MKIAKTFKWQAAHRLPWHQGNCKNLHGHSYCMTVESEGTPQKKGMLMDFADLKQIVKPLVEAWDHATLVAESDPNLVKVLQQLESKHFTLPFDSTAENLCMYVVNYIQKEGVKVLKQHQVEVIRVKIQETETCYAETECLVRHQLTKPNFAYQSA